MTNLDSFLNMDYFAQRRVYPSYENNNTEIHTQEGYDTPWRLYENGRPVYELKFPEGSKLGVNITNLDGIYSVIIPASDTARREPLGWCKDYIQDLRVWPYKIQFKADSGYDLRYYMINAEYIDLPSKMEVFNGLGTIRTDNWISDEAYEKNWKRKPRVFRWPETLHTILTTAGIELSYSPIPATIRRIETIRVDSIIEQLEFNFADDPLEIGKTEKSNEQSKIEWLILNRAIQRIDFFNPYLFDVKIDNIIFDDKFTKIPVRIFNPTYRPEIIICKSSTPPEFEATYPDIIPSWCNYTNVIVPKGSEETYRNHPIWGQFRIYNDVDEVNKVSNDDDIVSEQWYTLDGKIIKTPEPGGIYIHTIFRSDGSATSQKVVMPR